ncbi:MAG: hypothetical protein AAF085_15405 [Planctomycetota bacterium]
MTRFTLLFAVLGVWGLAYADWLAPGWLTFGLPASVAEPFKTSTTYDLGCRARRSLRQAAVTALENQTPDWAEFWHWDLNLFDKETEAAPTPCQSQQGEDR